MDTRVAGMGFYVAGRLYSHVRPEIIAMSPRSTGPYALATLDKRTTWPSRTTWCNYWIPVINRLLHAVFRRDPAAHRGAGIVDAVPDYRPSVILALFDCIEFVTPARAVFRLSYRALHLVELRHPLKRDLAGHRSRCCSKADRATSKAGVDLVHGRCQFDISGLIEQIRLMNSARCKIT